MKVKVTIVDTHEQQVEVPDKFDEFIAAMRNYDEPGKNYTEFWEKWGATLHKLDTETAKITGIPLADDANAYPCIVCISAEDGTILSEF